MQRSTRTHRPGSGPSTTSCILSSDRRNACARSSRTAAVPAYGTLNDKPGFGEQRVSRGRWCVEFCVRVGTGIPAAPLLPGWSDSRPGRNRRTPSPSRPATPATTRRALAFTSCRTLGRGCSTHAIAIVRGSGDSGGSGRAVRRRAIVRYLTAGKRKRSPARRAVTDGVSITPIGGLVTARSPGRS